MITKVEFRTYKGQAIADVTQICPMCEKSSHVVFTGNKIADTVRDYLSGRYAMQQDLPFEIPVREFLRTGYCRRCMGHLFGTTSNKIKYVKERERK